MNGQLVKKYIGVSGLAISLLSACQPQGIPQLITPAPDQPLYPAPYPDPKPIDVAPQVIPPYPPPRYPTSAVKFVPSETPVRSPTPLEPTIDPIYLIPKPTKTFLVGSGKTISLQDMHQYLMLEIGDTFVLQKVPEQVYAEWDNQAILDQISGPADLTQANQEFKAVAAGYATFAAWIPSVCPTGGTCPPPKTVSLWIMVQGEVIPTATVYPPPLHWEPIYSVSISIEAVKGLSIEEIMGKLLSAYFNQFKTPLAGKYWQIEDYKFSIGKIQKAPPENAEQVENYWAQVRVMVKPTSRLNTFWLAGGAHWTNDGWIAWGYNKQMFKTSEEYQLGQGGNG